MSPRAQIMLILHQLRPHQLVYQSALVWLSLVFAYHSETALTLFQLGYAFLSILTITPSYLVLNDYLHRQDDHAMRRGRVTLNGTQLVYLFLVLQLFLSISALLIDWLVCGAFWLLLGTTLLYAFAKQQRQLAWTYLGRWSSGSTTFLFYGLVLNPLTPTLVLLAFAVGLLDVAGNLAGDLRDLTKDQQAGVQTLPVRSGIPLTLGTIIVLFLIGTFLFSNTLTLSRQAFVLLSGWTGVGISFYFLVSAPWRHAVFHGPKVLIYVWIGGFLFQYSFLGFILVTLFFGSAWLLAYEAYVQQIPSYSVPIASQV